MCISFTVVHPNKIYFVATLTAADTDSLPLFKTTIFILWCFHAWHEGRILFGLPGIKICRTHAVFAV